MDEKVELNEKMKENDEEVIIKSEMFPPKLMINVLLVESDRSTRRMITALLKKCNYKVIAVSNGLKAWETLKTKAADIDLVLTEVDLPEISGLALLNLIMEHEICKNIPVIMMSPHGSQSTVMSCMFKGAADFLIKPVRRNELTNLWQHVWRKHAISRSLQNTTSAERHKIATEDNSAGNQLTNSVSETSSQKNNECSEKLCEVQTTCPLPISDAKNAYVKNMQNASEKSSLKLSNVDVLKHEESNKIERESTKHDDETRDSRSEQDYGNDESETKDEIFKVELSRETSYIDTEIRGCNDELIESSSKAIDLISTFDNLHKFTKEIYCLGDQENEIDFETELKLSLRTDFTGSSSKQTTFKAELSRENADIDTEIGGCSDELTEISSRATDLIVKFGNLHKCPKEIHCLNDDKETKFDFEKTLKLSLTTDFSDCSSKQACDTTEERQRLNHSNTSAFSRYSGSKKLGPLSQNSNWNSNKSPEISVVTADNYFQYGGSIKMENMATANMAQYRQLGPNLFNLLADNALDHMRTPKPNCQNESSPFPSSSSSQSNPESHNSGLHHHCPYDANYSFLNREVTKKFDLDHLVHGSPTSSQGFGNDFCHASNHNNSSDNDGRTTSAVVTKFSERAFSKNKTLNSESSSGGRFHNYDCYDYDDFTLIDSHCSNQREASLTRYRSKRKDRCFEKKVRYESRKRLAENRHRVKGQFVRKVHNDDHPNADASGDK